MLSVYAVSISRLPNHGGHRFSPDLFEAGLPERLGGFERIESLGSYDCALLTVVCRQRSMGLGACSAYGYSPAYCDASREP